jgi:hypothetical protein
VASLRVPHSGSEQPLAARAHVTARFAFPDTEAVNCFFPPSATLVDEGATETETWGTGCGPGVLAEFPPPHALLAIQNVELRRLVNNFFLEQRLEHLRKPLDVDIFNVASN